MKLSKKIIAAFSVAAMLVTALSVTGCKKEEDDDPYEMIAKVNNNYYTISHTNTAADTIQRGYKATHFQHAGALVNITFNSEKSTGTYGDGVLGTIFGLESNKDGSKNFYVIGIRNKGDYYISQNKNVKDLQGNNFGADKVYKKSVSGDDTRFANETATAEYEIVDFTSIPAASLKTATNSIGATIFYKDTVDDTQNADKTYTHTYKVYILPSNTTATKVKDGNGDLLDANSNVVSLDSETLVASIEYKTDSKSYTQRQFALYANVYPKDSNCSASYAKAKGTGTVKGNWTVLGDFKHADVVED